MDLMVFSIHSRDKDEENSTRQRNPLLVPERPFGHNTASHVPTVCACRRNVDKS